MLTPNLVLLEANECGTSSCSSCAASCSCVQHPTPWPERITTVAFLHLGGGAVCLCGCSHLGLQLLRLCAAASKNLCFGLGNESHPHLGLQQLCALVNATVHPTPRHTCNQHRGRVILTGVLPQAACVDQGDCGQTCAVAGLGGAEGLQADSKGDNAGRQKLGQSAVRL